MSIELNERNIGIAIRRIQGNLAHGASGNGMMFVTADVELLLGCIEQLRKELGDAAREIEQCKEVAWKQWEILELYEDAYRMADRREV